jgi:hypothetical protein
VNTEDDKEEAETRAELTEWWDNQPKCLSCGRPRGEGHLDWCLRKKIAVKGGREK